MDTIATELPEGIITMLHNTKTDTFHTNVFVHSPLPGPPSDDKPKRYRSKMHHTKGFPTREEAVASLPELQKNCSDYFGRTELSVEEENDVQWNGEDIPADVAFFILVDGKITRAQ